MTNVQPSSMDVGSAADISLPKFRCQPVTRDEVLKIIKGFKNKISCGYDQIPISLIKSVAVEIADPLVHVVNSSFISGYFPDQLKISKVIPIFKKGDATNKENYRPISIQPSFSKIFEKCMYNRLSTFLEENNIFEDEQHGFRRGRSVVTAATCFIENVIKDLDSKKKVLAILMDLTKAFDRVCHAKLTDSLYNCGIRGVYLEWIKSFYENRSQYVEMTYVKNNEIIRVHSKLEKLKNSVPQGSILGPLLFNCYTRGLVLKLANLKDNNKLTMYADDINLKVSDTKWSNLRQLSEISLNLTDEFLKGKNLIMNTTKTNYIVFDLKNKFTDFLENTNFNIDLKNQCLERKKSAKFLGLTIDHKLLWTEHVDNLCKKLSSGLFALRKMSYYCDTSILLILYHAQIQSHIQFGLQIYGGTSHSNMVKVLIAQKKAVRIILKMKYHEPCKEKFIELRILTVFSLYVFQLVLYAKQNQHKLKKYKDFHSYSTRNKENFKTDCHRTELFKKMPEYMGPKLLNYIPENIKKENNINIFKTNLKEFLIKMPLYSLEEFFVTFNKCNMKL
uniref:Reverse transcriptase domain-containing protein n=1 Tax=Graphocephala atropunctata TaxID=36148 RepID=A0A1B6KJW0_9HEMI